MSPTRVLGIVALAVGLVLLGFGYRASNAPLEQVSDALTGGFTSRTMWLLVGGGAAALGGVLLLVLGRRG